MPRAAIAAVLKNERMGLFSSLRGGKRGERLDVAFRANTPSWLAFQIASLLVCFVMIVILLPLYLRVYRPSVEREESIALTGFTGSPEEGALLPDSYESPLEDRIEVGVRCWLERLVTHGRAVGLAQRSGAAQAAAQK